LKSEIPFSRVIPEAQMKLFEILSCEKLKIKSSNLKSATEKLFTTGIECEIQEINDFLKILYFE
jgi:hypothetical protein